ncbi:MAG: ATP-binding protein [Anaerolineae bacterium]
MSRAQDTHSLQAGEAGLRDDTLRLAALFCGSVACLAIMLLALEVWFVPAHWAAAAALSAGAVSAVLLQEKNPLLGSALLVGGTVLATLCTVSAFASPGLVYLFAVPILFASVLLSQSWLFATAGVSILSTLAISLARGGEASGPPILRLASADALLPVAILALVTGASWISTRNLRTALEWAWYSYERARLNEQVARERQAELKRTLKALDETSHGLERANHMLAAARDQAEEARRLKQQFAQTISHELRTPLNLIVGFAELMVQSPEYYGGELTPAYRRDISIIYRNACHLQNLVNDVLDLARIEVAQMGLLPEETDPAALVQEAVNTVRSLVEARGLALETQIEPDLPRLWVDPTRIRQVLFNLLNNAARFTEQGRVSVRVYRSEQEVIFAVADTGMGIPSNGLAQVFEEFRQLDGSMRRRHGGAGLGLAICRRFVELHRGRIWVESQVGRGSTFSFALPISVPESTAGLGHGPALVPGRPAPETDAPMLLVATPSPSAASLLSRYVRGCRTVAVADLEHAGHVARQTLPQAVVLDQAMGPLPPAGLAELAKAWNLGHVPIVQCPLPGEEPLRQRLQVDGYLIKPVSYQRLWDVLRPFGDSVDKVLLVDDDRDFLLLLSRMLDSPLRRYQVLSASSGQEGLDMLLQHRPDLVLLDLMLPDIAGGQVAERIRANPLTKQTPIVIVSGQDQMDSLENLLGAISLAMADGLSPCDVVKWVQHALSPSAPQT